MVEALKKVVVSSTRYDLKRCRKMVGDAIWRQGLFPEMMERLAASSEGKVNESLRMIRESQIYVGIFARRYGEVPVGHSVSMTEMEYDLAVTMNIPRLIFIASDKFQPENGDTAVDLRQQAFIAKLERDTNNVVNYFDSAIELKAHVINSLSAYRRRDDWNIANPYIPRHPDPYIPHPYSLMQVKELVGRVDELEKLNGWINDPTSDVSDARIFSIVAIGGMGKSALTWQWFNSEENLGKFNFKGRMWWSFYNPSSDFANFVLHSLSYVSGRDFSELEKMKLSEQVDTLIGILDREKFLLVFDGVERSLLAYDGLDASRMLDEQLDAETGSILPERREKDADSHRLRNTTDRRLGDFFNRLRCVQHSRILMSTRLVPADLQSDGIRDRPGFSSLPLKGLKDHDALNLWKSKGGKTSDVVLSVLNRCDNHPMVVQVLASTVAKDRRSNGDFDAWIAARPNFLIGSLQLVTVKSHVISYVAEGLSALSLKALHVIAAFQMPTSYATLASILVGPDAPCYDESILDETLSDLEERGLLGWDRETGQHDVHPLTRSVVWDGLIPSDRTKTFELLEKHFAAVPPPAESEYRLERLTPTIEMFHTLIGQERFDDAHRLFFDRLATPLLRWQDAHRLRVKMLETLFPTGIKGLPKLSSVQDQAQALNALSLAYRISGRPGPAAELSQLDVDLLDQRAAGGDDLGQGRGKLMARALRNLAMARLATGQLRRADSAARRAILVDRKSADDYAPYWEALDLGWLGNVWSIIGDVKGAERCYKRSLKIMEHYEKPLSQARFNLSLAGLALQTGDIPKAQSLIEEAKRFFANADDKEMRDAGSLERELLGARKLETEVMQKQGEFTRAEEVLYEILAKARTHCLVREESQIWIELARQNMMKKNYTEAERQLEEVWIFVEFGPYRLLNADAKLIQAHIFLGTGKDVQAKAAALNAFDLAVCDGSRHCYLDCVGQSQRLLRENWGIRQEINSIANDTSPLPDIDIDPPGQFYVGQ